MHEIIAAKHESRQGKNLIVMKIRLLRLSIVDGYNTQTGEYYLERNSRLTDHIMDYFATGKLVKTNTTIRNLGSLHKPHNSCVERFKEELEFWKISKENVGLPTASEMRILGGRML